MRMKKQTPKKNNHWDKVFVISGEPQFCKFALEESLANLQNPGCKRYYRTDKISNIKEAFSSFSFHAIPDVIIINNPKAETLKMCQSVLESGPFNASGLIIYNPGDSLDGRLGFVSQATKNKRVYHFDYIEALNTVEILKYIKNWESGTSVSFTDEARKWLVQNVPTTTGKIKSGTGKREVEVVDFENLEKELDKPYVLRFGTQNKISLEDLHSYCVFEREYDLWAFISAAISGDTKEAYAQIEEMLKSQDIKTALALLMSQLKFLIGLKSLGNSVLNTASEYTIAAELSIAKYLNRYLGDDWLMSEQVYEAPAVNPWRVKKACESISKWSIEQLCDQYIATACAYKDLRFGVSEDILIPYLMLALSGKLKYTEPITHA
jgi:DNA polymerase III delta subunit